MPGGGQTKQFFAKILRFSRAFECTDREVEIRFLVFLMILGRSEWPDRAEEVDFYPGGSIWKGFEPPAESQNFAKFWNAWGVCLFFYTQGSL